MKKSTSLIVGVLVTVVVFGISAMSSSLVTIDEGFIIPSFATHSVMLVISVMLIAVLSKKKIISFPFKKAKFKYYIFGILLSLLTLVVTNIIATIILKASGFQIDPSGKGHSVVANLSPLQFFVFIFLYASISEEFLFRGFAQNFLHPFKSIGMRVNEDIFISLPVIIAGVLFGLAHLILLTTETSGPMIFRIVLSTAFLGITAGYFQEKYKNIAIAIVIHMTFNLPGLVMSFF